VLMEESSHVEDLDEINSWRTRQHTALMPPQAAARVTEALVVSQTLYACHIAAGQKHSGGSARQDRQSQSSLLSPFGSANLQE
jgi:hypothetical protein